MNVVCLPKRISFYGRPCALNCWKLQSGCKTFILRSMKSSTGFAFITSALPLPNDISCLLPLRNHQCTFLYKFAETCLQSLTDTSHLLSLRESRSGNDRGSSHQISRACAGKRPHLLAVPPHYLILAGSHALESSILTCLPPFVVFIF